MEVSNESIKNLRVSAGKQSVVDISSFSRSIIKIKVFGVGGGGGNVLKRLAESGLQNVELIAINTDVHALSNLNNEMIKKIQIGMNLTRGRGTGGKTDIGEQAALKDADRLKEMIEDSDIVFITAGMGCGTGTGAAPVIAEIAKTLGILTIGMVTVPFGFEGIRKQKIANEGIAKMQANMDALVVIQNDNLLKLQENKALSFVDAFKAVDSILHQSIRCIAELILTTGFINVDFADVQTIFHQSSSSEAILGIGQSNISVIKAVQAALESPLLDKSVKGARGVILNITGDETLSLYEVNEAVKYLFDSSEDDVNIILGIVIDKVMHGIIQATIIATDFSDSLALKAPQIPKTHHSTANTYRGYGYATPPPPNNHAVKSEPPKSNIIPMFSFSRDKKK